MFERVKHNSRIQSFLRARYSREEWPVVLEHLVLFGIFLVENRVSPSLLREKKTKLAIRKTATPSSSSSSSSSATTTGVKAVVDSGRHKSLRPWHPKPSSSWRKGCDDALEDVLAMDDEGVWWMQREQEEDQTSSSSASPPPPPSPAAAAAASASVRTPEQDDRTPPRCRCCGPHKDQDQRGDAGEEVAKKKTCAAGVGGKKKAVAGRAMQRKQVASGSGKKRVVAQSRVSEHIRAQRAYQQQRQKAWEEHLDRVVANRGRAGAGGERWAGVSPARRSQDNPMVIANSFLQDGLMRGFVGEVRTGAWGSRAMPPWERRDPDELEREAVAQLWERGGADGTGKRRFGGESAALRPRFQAPTTVPPRHPTPPRQSDTSGPSPPPHRGDSYDTESWPSSQKSIFSWETSPVAEVNAASGPLSWKKEKKSTRPGAPAWPSSSEGEEPAGAGESPVVPRQHSSTTNMSQSQWERPSQLLGGMELPTYLLEETEEDL